MDDSDYLLHQALAKDLQNRTGNHKCPSCYAHAAYQLGLCYEIGFGLERDAQLSQKWISEARKLSKELPKIERTLKALDDNYEPQNPKRLWKVLGYEYNLPFDPVGLYRVQDRLEAAELAFKSEIKGRADSMGKRSRSRLNLMSTLALILAARRDLEGAESVCRESFTSSQEAFGNDDQDTVGAQNYLLYILMQQKKYSELEPMLLELIKRKAKNYGPSDGTTLASRNILGAVYFHQGRYNDCLREMRDLTKIREKINGPEQEETLTSSTWISKALLESKEYMEAESHHRKVTAISERVLGPEHEATLERKELLAAILIELGQLEEAEYLAMDVIDHWEESFEASRGVRVWVRAMTDCSRIETLSGDVEKAKRRLEEAIERGKKILGEEDVDILRALSTLVAILGNDQESG